jgi:hypothetical protein
LFSSPVTIYATRIWQALELLSQKQRISPFFASSTESVGEEIWLGQAAKLMIRGGFEGLIAAKSTRLSDGQLAVGIHSLDNAGGEATSSAGQARENSSSRDQHAEDSSFCANQDE